MPNSRTEREQLQQLRWLHGHSPVYVTKRRQRISVMFFVLVVCVFLVYWYA